MPPRPPRSRPPIFGADGDRTYLLVVQNNAESRRDRRLHRQLRAHHRTRRQAPRRRHHPHHTWNEAIAQHADGQVPGAGRLHAAATASTGRRHDTAERQPVAGLPERREGADEPGPAGRAPEDRRRALRRSRRAGRAAGAHRPGHRPGPGRHRSTAATSSTSRCATPTPAFAATPDRADFLGDVAKAAVDKATTGTLGKPAQIAKVLGGAAHAGHLILAFARPDEQQLADQLGVSGRLDPVRSDALAVTTSNFAGNKIDYYLDRAVDYRVKLTPNDTATTATARRPLGRPRQHRARRRASRRS